MIDLLEKYPLAQLAIWEHDDFYERNVPGGMPADVKAGRERAMELIDRYIDKTAEAQDALMVVALIGLDPLPCHTMYGDPAYGKDVERLMTLMINTAKLPGQPLPQDIAAVVTIISVIKMEQAMDEVQAGKLDVTPQAVKATSARGAANDALYLPNLHNKAVQDLYETTQFAYFSQLERAALKPKAPKPPKPPSFGGPVF
jgi:hypothetical protein